MAIYQTRTGTRDKSSSRKSGDRPLRAARKAGDHPHKRLMTDPFIGDRNTATHLLQAVTTTPAGCREPSQPHVDRGPIFVLDHHETTTTTKTILPRAAGGAGGGRRRRAGRAGGGRRRRRGGRRAAD